jgi:hypothetical protein
VFLAWALVPILAPPDPTAAGAGEAPMACCVASGEACECRIVTGLTRCPSTTFVTPPSRTPCVSTPAFTTVDALARAGFVEAVPTSLVSFEADPLVPPPRA